MLASPLGTGTEGCSYVVSTSTAAATERAPHRCQLLPLANGRQVTEVGAWGAEDWPDLPYVAAPRSPA